MSAPLADRTAEMVCEIIRAADADADAWKEAGELAEIAMPASLELRARLIADDSATAFEAYHLLVRLLEEMVNRRREDGPPPAA